MAGLGMQVREAPICLLPLEPKEQPDRWTTSTGWPAAAARRTLLASAIIAAAIGRREQSGRLLRDARRL